MRLTGWALVQSDWHLVRTEDENTEMPEVLVSIGEWQQVGGRLPAKERGLRVEEALLTPWTCTSSLQTCEGKKKVSVVKRPGLRYFLTATLTNDNRCRAVLHDSGVMPAQICPQYGSWLTPGSSLRVDTSFLSQSKGDGQLLKEHMSPVISPSHPCRGKWVPASTECIWLWDTAVFGGRRRSPWLSLVPEESGCFSPSVPWEPKNSC